jgi:hypothetical protein
MPEPIFTKLGIYNIATELISTAYFINPSNPSVCLCVQPSYDYKETAWLSLSLLSMLGNGSVNTLPWQRIHATIEELLDAPFSMRSVFYQRRVCGSVCVSPYRCWVNTLPQEREYYELFSVRDVSYVRKVRH